MNSGRTGGNSQPTPQAVGSISGFRPQGQPITQNLIAAQQHAHVTNGSTQAFTGSSARLNGQSPGRQPRDQVVRQRINPPTPLRIGPSAVGGPDRAVPAATIAPSVASSRAPISASRVPTAPAASSGGTASGADVYNTLINTIVDREDRERTPRRGDRAPLALQRQRQELDAMTDREKALFQRDKTIPKKPPFYARPAPIATAKPKKPIATATPLRPAAIAKTRSKKPPIVSVAASSSSQPPPPPGAPSTVIQQEVQ